MFGSFDPKKMQAAMKQLGMSQEEIPSSKVTIEKTDGSKIVVENPSVMKLTIQGQESFQVSGNVKEELGISEEDIRTVMEKTGAGREEVKKTLESVNGDLAEAVLKLSK